MVQHHRQLALGAIACLFSSGLQSYALLQLSVHNYGRRSAFVTPRSSTCIAPVTTLSSSNQDDVPSPSIESTSSGIQTQTSKRTKALEFLSLRKSYKHQKPTTPNELEDGTKSKEDVPFEAGPFQVTTVDELNDYYNDVRGRFRKRKGSKKSNDEVGSHDDIDYDALLASLSVKGDTQKIGSPDHKDAIHPVVKLVHERRRQIEKIKSATKNNDVTTQINDNSRNIHRTMPPEDGFRVALAVEGGGMRGCVTAGMVTAIHHLGLEDTIDVVYGSSAGTVIGAYFITRQLPWYGPEVYYDALTTAGDTFINTKRFLRAVGLGFLDPRLVKDVIFRRNHGKPVLDLSFLLKTTMQEKKPLDWKTFEEMQKVQPLRIMASGLKSQKAIVMDMERGSFRNIKEMANCMQASCLLPGVAGAVMNLKSFVAENSTAVEYQMSPRNRVEGENNEPLADALMFEPLPFRSAVGEGATHVICLRSRPDGVDVTGKTSIFEKLIVRRFFLRKNRLRSAFQYMRKHLHKRRYAEDVIVLNEAGNDFDRSYADTDKPHLMPIAVPPGSPEVTRLETGREAIFEGVRRGFARAYDALVEDVDQRGKGVEVAKQVFPDDILNYDPLVYTSTTESAYEAYLKTKESSVADSQ
ncbi:predicted protein [Thalassiosira pseudonana CCMP1335]|uniref:PNPLA domain-containing protein n=1 Tax=Thalassiosira pseudonana TaxID=35128 RepID=B8BUM9_THAPS|nr:predicted protein [Thalassiosira pseudonana CCMP1335]EED94788.1 predicted protein [Thalassiosira pseudonana CCMP1335]|eukprot:g10248.t1 g10248   contig4:1514764-1516674(-)